MSNFDQITGPWRYRSFLNVLQPITDSPMSDLLFGEGDLFLNPDGNGLITDGLLSFGPDSRMRFTGQVRRPSPGCGNVPAISLEATAFGVEGTQTAGWVYAYQGWLLPTWPYGADQVAAIAGTVVRVVAHGPQSPAGVVASFVAVRLPLVTEPQAS